MFPQLMWGNFSDTQYSWYKDSISQLQKLGIVNGHGDGTFKPEWNITRAEILKIILRSGNVSVPDHTPSCFNDVDASMWYNSYICTAKELGIARGFESGMFKPNETVTTLEALAFGFRAFSITPTETGKNWYDGYRDFAHAQNILMRSDYTLATKISRGKASELIERIKDYRGQIFDSQSVGCLKPGALNTLNTIVIDGVSREYNLFVPSGYSSKKSYGLVVALHGRTNSKDMVQSYMGLQSSKGRKSSTEQSDYIIAYPAGMKVKGGYSWSEHSNVTFFDAILRDVSENYCIDRGSIFVVGHSLGAWFANKLACIRGEVIRGMAAIGGPGYAGACSGPVASILFHDPKDHLVPFTSGKAAESNRITENQCGNSREEISLGSFSCKAWNQCSPGNSVIWCETYTTYRNDPHGWPIGGGASILEGFREM